MGLRFRRSIKIAPGIRWNLSTGGSSFTFGPRGASVNVGKHGVYVNAGIPGTGLSSRGRLLGHPPGQPSALQRPRNSPELPGGVPEMAVHINLTDDGTLAFLDAQGTPLPESLIALAKRQHRDEIEGLLQRACETINEEVAQLARLHFDTPNCSSIPRAEVTSFAEVPPVAPRLMPRSIWARLFRRPRERANARDRSAQEIYRTAIAAWDARRAGHRDAEAAKARAVEHACCADPIAMEEYLEARLAGIVWPRETGVEFEVNATGTQVVLDVDLPELEDMPTKQASIPPRGLRLTLTTMPTSAVRQLYLRHIYSVAFRLVGEAFALPTVQTVTLSGYSQRREPRTGAIRDEYLISVRAFRSDWQVVDFSALPHVDLATTLEQHELRRNVQPTGKLLSIQPISPAQPP